MGQTRRNNFPEGNGMRKTALVLALLLATCMAGCELGTIATPEFSPPGGTYMTTQSVTLSSTPGAAIRYTTDGSMPTSTSGTEYTGPIAISEATTVNAIAYKAVRTDSDVASATFSIMNSTLSSLGLAIRMIAIMPITQTDTYRGMTLTSYALSEAEITQGDYETIIGSNPAGSYGVGSDYPVYYVPWFAAAHFCNALSTLVGLGEVYDETNWEADFTKSGFYLPTEAQWEYSAGGPNHYTWSLDYTFNASDYVMDDAQSRPVKSHPANGYGLYDMNGNVYEWCNDWYGDYPYYGETDPTGPASGTSRVCKGGAWNSTEYQLHWRWGPSPNFATNDIGLRVALGGHGLW
jgi:hypothetical protein